MHPFRHGDSIQADAVVLNSILNDRGASQCGIAGYKPAMAPQQG
jgi:hypothetical protein